LTGFLASPRVKIGHDESLILTAVLTSNCGPAGKPVEVYKPPEKETHEFVIHKVRMAGARAQLTDAPEGCMCVNAGAGPSWGAAEGAGVLLGALQLSSKICKWLPASLGNLAFNACRRESEP